VGHGGDEGLQRRRCEFLSLSFIIADVDTVQLSALDGLIAYRPFFLVKHGANRTLEVAGLEQYEQFYDGVAESEEESFLRFVRLFVTYFSNSER